MNYAEAIDYLYSATPQFQQIGAAAYKPGLDTVTTLSAIRGDSHTLYPVIHIAGTNGKGTTAHSIAAVLQDAGYKTGLFTSPHLLDFRERIRVNGEMVSKEDVCQWLDSYIKGDYGLSPSFFELTTVMAFDLFAKNRIDVAVIETGLGGRLDSTNIVNPVLTVITNISKDHVAQLGESLEAIAYEKAGIVKPRVPLILGEGDNPCTRKVIVDRAVEQDAPVVVASDEILFDTYVMPDNPADGILYKGTPYGDILAELSGDYQVRNTNTILHVLRRLISQGWRITADNIRNGLGNVSEKTGLRGRWAVLRRQPLVICDTGHNEGGWSYLSKALSGFEGRLRMVIGFVNDKDVNTILSMMPKNAVYYFTRASVPRALDANELATLAKNHGLSGTVCDNVAGAIDRAIKDDSECGSESMIFVGGSTFVVADALAAESDF